MNIIIAGDGEVGFHLARSLTELDYNITVVDPHSELLKRLDAQSIRPAHVRVINTEEPFWESRFEQDFPGLIVTHITKQEFDHGGTRNRMAEESDADLLLFMTQDALPADRRLLENLAAQFFICSTALCDKSSVAKNPDNNSSQGFLRFFR